MKTKKKNDKIIDVKNKILKSILLKLYVLTNIKIKTQSFFIMAYLYFTIYQSIKNNIR